MKKTRVAINGFGRIGRLAARIILSSYPNIELVAVNDLTSVENLAYLFEFDTIYRKYNKSVSFDEHHIIIDSLPVKVLSEKDPAKLPWKELAIDIVIECTGFFLTEELAQLHVAAGAKKVILSAPSKSESIPTVVFGANIEAGLLDETLRSSAIISNASCTTNCIAPALKVLDDQFAIKTVFALTNHAYTATQPLQDGPTKKDFRDGRAGATNLIPSKTGAAKAVELVLPDLKGKVNLSSLRVPVQVGSMIYVVVELEDHQTTSIEEVNLILKTAAETDLDGILEYSTTDLVSSDIIGNSHSIILDSSLTEVLANSIKLVLWYDNEWGYSNRLVELVNLIAN
jgi:glyceraldehyde 3-phosphate dehydrogenase